MHHLFCIALSLSALLPLAQIAQAETAVSARAGWAVHASAKPYTEVISDLKNAVKAQGLFVVTQAGPTKAAAARGITIPGNRVVGVFNNDYALRVLAASTAAMIEAPIRFYVTENEDGTASLSYKRPSHIFAPYFAEGGDVLQEIAEELDQQFDQIASTAIR